MALVVVDLVGIWSVKVHGSSGRMNGLELGILSYLFEAMTSAR